MGNRIFVFDGRQFPDPDPNLSVDEVRQHLMNFFPEVFNAETRESKQGEDTTIIEFSLMPYDVQVHKAAQELIAQLASQLGEPQPATLSVAQTKLALNLYFKDAKERLAPKSVKTYQDCATALLKAFPDELPTPQAFDTWLSHQKVSKSTKHTRFKHSRAMFRWLNKRYGIPDITAGLDSPPPGRDDPPFLTVQELEIVVNMPLSNSWGRYTQRDYALLRVMQRSGIRVGGALGLEQTDLHEGYMLVSQKGKQGPVVCDNETIDLLRKLGNPHIFVGERGRPLGYPGARKVIKKALRKAGFDRRGLATHVMRRGFATAMNLRGMPDITLSRMMKHAKVQQTEEYVKKAIEPLLSQYSRYSPWHSGNETYW